MAKLRHPNMVTVMAVCSDSACVLTELALGNLSDALFKPQSPAFEEFRPLRVTRASLLKALVDMCKGVSFLHASKIVHRDLKPQNILVFRGGLLKLADFGLSRSLDSLSGTFAGTPVYMAPEILLKREDYDESVDVFSLGLIMCEAVSGHTVVDPETCARPKILSLRRKAGTPPFALRHWLH